MNTEVTDLEDGKVGGSFNKNREVWKRRDFMSSVLDMLS